MCTDFNLQALYPCSTNTDGTGVPSDLILSSSGAALLVCSSPIKCRKRSARDVSDTLQTCRPWPWHQRYGHDTRGMAMTPQTWPCHHRYGHDAIDMAMTPQTWPWHHTDMAMTPHRHGHDTTDMAMTPHRHGHDTTDMTMTPHRHGHDTTHTWPWHHTHRLPDMPALAMTLKTQITTHNQTCWPWPWHYRHGHDTKNTDYHTQPDMPALAMTPQTWPWHHRDRDYQTQNGRAQGQTSFKHKFLTIKQKNCNGCIFKFHSHW